MGKIALRFIDSSKVKRQMYTLRSGGEKMKKVVKFGGSSLASAEQFKKVGAIIRSDAGRRFVVPSAPGKRFDRGHEGDRYALRLLCPGSRREGFGRELRQIEQRYQEIIDGLELKLSLEKEFSLIRENFAGKAGKDYAASRGEYLNGIVMANYLGYEFVDAAEVIVFCEDGSFDMDKTTEVLGERLKDMKNAVIPGFYGALPDGHVITFSRGGSDITGSLVAAAIHADIYENWTDVSGFLVTDPRIVVNPEVIETITYRELRELSYMGATVLHEEAIFPCTKGRHPHQYPQHQRAGRQGYPHRGEHLPEAEIHDYRHRWKEGLCCPQHRKGYDELRGGLWPERCWRSLRKTASPSSICPPASTP